MDAVIMQHEIDHQRGLLISDIGIPVSLEKKHAF
jgi:peptide deformylase